MATRDPLRFECWLLIHNIHAPFICLYISLIIYSFDLYTSSEKNIIWKNRISVNCEHETDVRNQLIVLSLTYISYKNWKYLVPDMQEILTTKKTISRKIVLNSPSFSYVIERLINHTTLKFIVRTISTERYITFPWIPKNLYPTGKH